MYVPRVQQRVPSLQPDGQGADGFASVEMGDPPPSHFQENPPQPGRFEAVVAHKVCRCGGAVKMGRHGR